MSIRLPYPDVKLLIACYWEIKHVKIRGNACQAILELASQHGLPATSTESFFAAVEKEAMRVGSELQRLYPSTFHWLPMKILYLAVAWEIENDSWGSANEMALGIPADDVLNGMVDLERIIFQWQSTRQDSTWTVSLPRLGNLSSALSA